MFIEGSLFICLSTPGFCVGSTAIYNFHQESVAEDNSFHNIPCHSCGGICSFADGFTIAISRSKKRVQESRFRGKDTIEKF